jgi:hypothetical protein
MKQYKSKFNVLKQFEKDLCPVFDHFRPDYPPRGPAIRLMWAQIRYSLYPSDWRQRHGQRDKTISFGTNRAMRSAASHYWLWDLLHAPDDKLTLGFKNRPLLVQGCSPTDEAAYTYFTDGFKRPVGNNPKPSAVLLLRHVLWLDTHYLSMYLGAASNTVKADICRAALTNVLAVIG